MKSSLVARQPKKKELMLLSHIEHRDRLGTRLRRLVSHPFRHHMSAGRLVDIRKPFEGSVQRAEISAANIRRYYTFNTQKLRPHNANIKKMPYQWAT